MHLAGAEATLSSAERESFAVSRAAARRGTCHTCPAYQNLLENRYGSFHYSARREFGAVARPARYVTEVTAFARQRLSDEQNAPDAPLWLDRYRPTTVMEESSLSMTVQSLLR